MPITREFTADKVNSILNHPEVRPHIADASESVIDIGKQVENENNVLLVGEHGACFFFKLMQGIYEVHTQVLPVGRGSWTRDFLQSVRHYIYTRTDAIDVLTRVPESHKGAEAAAKSVGMKYEFTRPDCKFEGKTMPVKIYSERLQDWAAEAPFLEERGAWLHKRMFEEAQRLDIKEPPHEDDSNHNRYVGAALEMAFGGYPQKAVAFYNRWAIVSRHATIQLVSLVPPTIRFDIGLLKLSNDDIMIETDIKVGG